MPSFAVTINKDSDIEALGPEDARKALAERNELLAKVFEEAGQGGDAMDPSQVQIEKFANGNELMTFVKNINGEISKIGEKVSEFDEFDRIRAETEQRQQHLDASARDSKKFAPATGGQGKGDIKSVGQAFVESNAYEAAKEHASTGLITLEGTDAKAFLEEKTTMTTGAGWAPESTRTGRVVLDAQRGIEITDALPVIPTSQAAIKYMEETTFTNNAAERSENAAYAESALALTERSQDVESVGTSLPVTDEQLEDVEGISSYIDNRLMFMVRQRVDSQVITGNGTPPNLNGTLNVSGIQTQALGADTVPDAIYKAMVNVEVTGRADPNVVIIHPTTWQGVRLLKTTDGVYIWGSPSEAGPERIWGKPIIRTSAIATSSAIVGDYARHSALHTRRGMLVQAGFVNDDFLDGRVTIRAGLRLAVVHYRPAAFCEVTGL